MRILFAGLLALICGVVGAQSFGSWVVEMGERRNFVFAATQSDSGHLFGQYCFFSSQNCIWMIGLPTRCKEESTYFVLGNSDAGAQQFELYCFGPVQGDRYAYAFADFSQADGFVRGASGRIGFALPLERDQFRVVRFQLDGATRALSAMRSIAEQNSNATPAKGTRDQVL